MIIYQNIKSLFIYIQEEGIAIDLGKDIIIEEGKLQ